MRGQAQHLPQAGKVGLLAGKKFFHQPGGELPEVAGFFFSL